MAKFKIGDRVRVVRDGFLCRGSRHEAPVGSIQTITSISGEKYQTNTWYFYEHEIELAECGPVRTITRREIVPGEYGDVIVGAGRRMEGGGTVEIHLSDNPDNYFNADELREAARIFNEIADALEENQKESA